MVAENKQRAARERARQQADIERSAKNREIHQQNKEIARRAQKRHKAFEDTFDAVSSAPNPGAAHRLRQDTMSRSAISSGYGLPQSPPARQTIPPAARSRRDDDDFQARFRANMEAINRDLAAN